VVARGNCHAWLLQPESSAFWQNKANAEKLSYLRLLLGVVETFM